MAAEIGRMRHQISDKERVIESFCRDLFVLKTNLHKIDASEGLTKLYSTYVSEERENANKASFLASREDAKLKEFARQRKFMEATVSQSKSNQRRTEVQERAKFEQKISENSQLIEEISMLRRSNMELTKRLQRLQVSVSDTVAGAAAAAVVGGLNSSGGGTRALSATIGGPASSTSPTKKGRPATSSFSRPSTAATRFSSPSPTPAGVAGAVGAHGGGVGRVIKGSTKPFELTAQERSKMVEMLAIIEENNAKMEGMRSEIFRLRDHVAYLLERTPAEALVRRDFSTNNRVIGVDDFDQGDDDDNDFGNSNNNNNNINSGKGSGGSQRRPSQTPPPLSQEEGARAKGLKIKLPNI